MGATNDHVSQFIVYELRGTTLAYTLFPTNDNPLGVYEAGIGINMAFGDINNDKTQEVIIASSNAEAQITPFMIINGKLLPVMPLDRNSTPTTYTSFTPDGIDPDVVGATVTIADIDSDPNDKIIAGQLFKEASVGRPIYFLLYTWNAEKNKIEPEAAIPSGFTTGATKGINVASGDVDNDGFDELIIGESFGSTLARIKIFDNELDENNSLVTLYEGRAFSTGKGVTVAVGNVDDEGREEIILGQGTEANDPDSTLVKVVRYVGNNTLETLATKTVMLPEYGINVASGDVNGDGDHEVIIGMGPNNVQNLSEIFIVYDYEDHQLNFINGTGFTPPGPQGVIVESGKPFKFNNFPMCGDGVCTSSVIGLEENQTITYGTYVIKAEHIEPRRLKISVNGNSLEEHVLQIGEVLEFVDLYIELINVEEGLATLRLGENYQLCPIDCEEDELPISQQ